MQVAGNTIVRDLMVEQVHTVQRMMPVLGAAKRMTENGVRHLIVIGADGRPCGVLSQRDLLKHLSPWLSMIHGANPPGRVDDSITVQDLMSQRLVTVKADVTLPEVAAIFVSTKFGCLPVVDESDYLIGVLSVIDLLRDQAESEEQWEKEFDSVEHSIKLSCRAYFEPNGNLVVPREALGERTIEGPIFAVLGYSPKIDRLALKLLDEAERAEGGRGARPVEEQDDHLIIKADDFRQNYGLEDVRDLDVSRDENSGNFMLSATADQPSA